MAIVEMCRLKLVGLKSERNKIMNTLTRSKLFEVMPTREIEGFEKQTDTSHLDRVSAKQARVAFAIEFLKNQQEELDKALADNEKEVKRGGEKLAVPEYKRIEKDGAVRTVIGYDDFYDTAAKEYELMTVVDALEKISFDKLDLRSKIGKLENQNKNLLPYRGCPLRFSQMGDTKYTSVVLAQSVSPDASAAAAASGMDAETEEYPYAGGLTAAFVVRAEDKQKLLSRLAECGFSLCQYRYDAAASELIAANLREIDALTEAVFSETKRALSYAKYLFDLKVLYDFMATEIEKSRAELDFIKTRSAFVIEGWVPKAAAESLLDEIRSKTDRVVTYLYDVEEGDEPPTLLKNPKFVQPFEDVTNMYSVPSYSEVDPNPFMAVFFFIFFGIMTADAGYGLVLSIGALIILKIKAFEKGTGRLIALIGMGGISAIVWGLLFGGIFSIQGIPPLWFNPMENPILMLAVSLILGVIQLMVGYGLMGYRLIKKGKVFSAIFDVGFIYLLVLGIGFLALNMLLKPSGAVLSTVGFVLILCALLGILCTAGRGNKGILSKIMGGFSGLYGLVNLFSDILSYSRLFGLGLASGAIGLAFNTLGSLMFGIPVVGYVVGIVLLIPLHAFNIALGVLGAYVHNARLQFLEFYGKFYDGGGSMFTPLGENTKYVRCA